MEPREFYIEDRLEKFRRGGREKHSPLFCNLGESGIRNITLGELKRQLNISDQEMDEISLADSANNGSLALRKEIALLYPGISPEQVLVTTGTGEALFLFFQLLQPSSASLFWPAFQALYEIPQMLGTKINRISALDNFNIADFFMNNPDLIIVNHPHNPTGKKLTYENIQMLTDKIANFKGYTLFDEHYRFLDFENDLSWTGAGLNDKACATGSITKCFGVTGLRVGWLIGDTNFLNRARSFKDYLTHTVNPVAEFLTLKIIQQRQILIIPIKNRIKINIEYFNRHQPYIKSILSFNPPEGGVVAFPKLKAGISSEKYCDDLYRECDIFVLPGAAFEAESYFRISFGEEEKVFQAGIDRWVKWENRH